MRPRRRTVLILAALGAVALFAASTQLPVIGAGALLHPWRRVGQAPPPPQCIETAFDGAGVRLAGWTCSARQRARGTVVYLHGIADNRESATGPIAHFLDAGFDVIAYDSRAHGKSEGEMCTYGFFEKDDLRKVIDTAQHRPIILAGASLGAAVALQHAARDSRVAAVVAAESFADLRSIATDRAPAIFTRGLIERAFRLAERRAHFTVDAVSPLVSAKAITAPVLVLHGADDSDTSPAHAERIYEALTGPRRLILVPGAGHNQSLRRDVWPEIDRWIESALRTPETQSASARY